MIVTEKHTRKGDAMSEPLIPGGYIILARSILESPTWKSLNLAHQRVFIEVLLQAQHTGKYVSRNGERIWLERGQIATSYQKLAGSINQPEITPKVVRGAIEKLCKLGFWAKDGAKSRAKKGILLTIVNYGLYQDPKSYQGQSDGQSDGQCLGRARAIYNNDNNVNKYIYKPGDEQEIFSYWNQKGIVTHQKITNHFHISIKRALMLYPVEQIKTAIDHYATMYFDESYSYCDYRWTIEKFLDDPKGIAYFFNDGQKWLSYINLRKGGSKNESEKIDDSDLIL